MKEEINKIIKNNYDMLSGVATKYAKKHRCQEYEATDFIHAFYLHLIDYCKTDKDLSYVKNYSAIAIIQFIRWNQRTEVRRSNLLKKYHRELEPQMTYPDSILLKKQIDNLVRKKILELPTSQQETIMAVLNGNSIREEADRTGISYNALKTRYTYAIKYLKGEFNV